MASNMVWDETKGGFVQVSEQKSDMIKVGISQELANTLKRFAKEDGFDFKGISYVTKKDAQGKTILKDGKPVYILDKDGKPTKIDIEESVAKVNSAISKYAEIAIKRLIAGRAVNPIEK